MKFQNKNILDSLNKNTVKVMITLFCKANHKDRDKLGEKLCNDCFQLEKYALQRLKNCPFGSEKPNCPKCPIHCYSKEMRERISVIMKYSGPRMVLKHPILAVYHISNNSRKVKLSGKSL